MINKKNIYMIVGIIAALIVSLIIYQMIENSRWGNVIQKNQDFVAFWGTYDYRNYDVYVKRSRDYLSEDLYREIFGDPMVASLKKAEIIDNKIEAETTVLKLKSKKRKGEIYTITSDIWVEDKNLDRNSAEKKTIRVEWQKVDEVFKVIKIEYLIN